MSPKIKPSDTPLSDSAQRTSGFRRNAQNSTRERIISYLRDHATVSAPELSRAWDLTIADIRYHLSALQTQGIIEYAPLDSGAQPQRGRPIRHYRLAAHMRPNNLPGLCHALLTLLANRAEGEELHSLQAIASLMVGEIPAAPTLTHRLNQVVAWLIRGHYRARWEAGAQGPRVLLRACPYASILAQHPELCQIDQVLLEHLLQTQVQQTVRMDILTGEPAACIFVVKPLFAPI